MEKKIENNFECGQIKLTVKQLLSQIDFVDNQKKRKRNNLQSDELFLSIQNPFMQNLHNSNITIHNMLTFI